VSSDQKNCGRCGHDCQGGACTAGACQPVQIFADTKGPYGIGVDATSVYWSDNGYINKCDKRGCSQPTVLAWIDGVSAGPGAIGPLIVVDATNVYWADNGGVRSCATSGCGQAPATLSSAGSAPLAVQGGSLFFEDVSGVVSCPVTGCGAQPTVVAANSGGRFMAADSQNVYWTNIFQSSGGYVEECSIQGCTSSTQIFGGYAADIAAGYGWVVWASNSGGGCPGG
jgi:hypothetical protein